jgi:hybrid cluster-associated redox disulfide protein
LIILQKKRHNKNSKKLFGGKNKMVNKNMVIGDVLDKAPQTASLFLEIGMHCLGCPASRGETIEEACEVHGTNADELVSRINTLLEKSA